MILPCGHTRAEHDAILNHHAVHARESFVGWIRRCQRSDPRDWPEALAEMADLIVCDLTGDTRAQAWTQRASEWSDELLVTLIALSAAACHSAGVRRESMDREGRRLDAGFAVAVINVAIARHIGRVDLDDILALGIDRLSDWEAMNAVHFGRSAIIALGMGAPDLLALVDTPGHDTSGV